MTAIIQHTTASVNTKIQPSSYHYDRLKSSSIPPRLFADINAQKRAWLSAAVIECRLRLNEPRILEAIIFNCDPITGIGEPSIGAIIEYFISHGWGYISYSAISQNIKRIKAKGPLRVTNRYEETNIYEMVGYKLANHSFDSHNNLIPTNSKQRDLNITHYDEYVSLKSNKGLKISNSTPLENVQVLTTPKSPELAPVADKLPPPEKLLKSEWEVKNETIEESLQEIVCKEIPQDQRASAVTTLKRLQATLEDKMAVLKEVGQLAKQMIIVNIGGLLVSRYKQLRERMKVNNSQTPRDHNLANRIRHRADEMAKQRLLKMGITDPRLRIGHTYDEVKDYDAQMAKMINTCMQDLIAPKPTEQRDIAPRQTWADVAYS